MRMRGLHWIDPDDEESPFPDVHNALREPDGLLAVGGNLSPARLIRAYRSGIFPWYNPGQPILWWSPDPRAVLFPERFQASRSLRKTLKHRRYSVTLDAAFRDVMERCAQPRPGQSGTWIGPEMIEAYCTLHALGAAHSVEVWRDGELAGGLYGVAIGKVFYGESMFSRARDASKVALACLARQLRAWDYAVIDCQVRSEHLASLGAEDLPREAFVDLLERCCTAPGHPVPWRFDSEILTLF